MKFGDVEDLDSGTGSKMTHMHIQSTAHVLLQTRKTTQFKFIYRGHVNAPIHVSARVT